MANIFRKAALDKLSSPDQLDKLITVTSPRGWITVLTVGLILACAIIWGVFGTIPQKVDTSGILISSGGVEIVSTKVSGQITDIRVANGDQVKQGDTLAIIGENDIIDRINTTNDTIKVLENLTPYMNWDSVVVPTELLEFQRIGLQIQSARAAAGSASLNPELARADYEAYQTLYEAGAVSKAEVDAKYSVWMNAQSAYSQQALAAEQYVAQFNSTKKSTLAELRENVESLRASIETQYSIVAPGDGKVSSVGVQTGDLVGPGAPIVTIAKTGSDVKALEAIIYVPVSDGKKITEGMEVKIYPSTVTKEEYGYMTGTVISVPEYPVDAATVRSTLGNEALAAALTGQGAPLEVRVDLIADANTVSGYAWSNKKGATVNVENGTLCGAAIVVSTQTPISLVIPLLKQKFLPFE